MRRATPKSPGSVACVVLNWNGAARIERCLQSLRSSRHVKPRILVVDNGSVDGSLDRVRERFAGVKIIRHDANIGLAAARNEGARTAFRGGAEFVLFIDDDAWLPPESLSLLGNILRGQAGVGVVTPRILYAKKRGRIWYDGGALGPAGDTVHQNMERDERGVLRPDAGVTVESAFATGCCMLVRRKAFENVAGFDEEYFVYCEDSDFSFRLRKKGWGILHAPGINAFHDVSGDTSANKGKAYRDYYVTRNTLRLQRIHGEGGRLLFLWYFLWKRVLIPDLYFIFTGQLRRAKAVHLGVRDYRRRIFGQGHFR